MTACQGSYVQVYGGVFVPIGTDVSDSLHGTRTWWEYCSNCRTAYRTNRRDLVWVKYKPHSPIPPVVLIFRHIAECVGLNFVPLRLTSNEAADQLASRKEDI